MSIYDSLGQANRGQMNPQAALQQIKANPGAILKQAGFNVPAGMNDPQSIINHLLRSGQVSNPRLQMAQQMMARMGRK